MGENLPKTIREWQLPPGEYKLLSKAQENYLCGLMAWESNQVNAAASRFYYALFLAAIEFLENEGMRPQDQSVRGNENKGRWLHRYVPQELWYKTKTDSHRNVLRRCYSERIKADYERIDVEARYYKDFLNSIAIMLQDLKKRTVKQ